MPFSGPLSRHGTRPRPTIITTRSVTGSSSLQSFYSHSVTGSSSLLASLPVSYVNVRNYGATGDGTTNDETALNNAISAALAATPDKSIYFPPGSYVVSDWDPPAGITCFGDGPTSHIKGKLLWRSDQHWTDLMIGSKTTAALGPYQTSGDVTHSNTTFTRCKFRGGGAYPTLNRPALGDTRSISDHNFVFDHCTWECSYNYNISATAQDVSWFIDRGSGDRATDIHFNYCHFGTLNEDGKTGGIYGGIVIWSSHSEDYAAYPNMANGYYDDFYFDRCIFERADTWNLDCSGAQYAPTSFTENTVDITNCVFKGLSGAYHSTLNGGNRICAQEEPGHDCYWNGNLFGIANTAAMKFIKGTSRSTFTNNLLDYRTHANTIDQQSGLPQIDEIYDINIIVRVDSDSAGISVLNNKLLLPKDKYTTLGQQSWIYDPSSRASKSGNSVKWATTTGAVGPLDAVKNLDFLPDGWTIDVGAW